MAKRFKFKLEPVLRFRASQEDEKLRDFAKAQGKVVEQNGYLSGLSQDKLSHQQEIVDLYAENKQDFAVIVDYYRFINSLDIRSSWGKNKLSNLDAEMEKRRKIYLEARKKRRALELLKEKRQKQHRYEEDRQEEKINGELAIQQFHQRLRKQQNDEKKQPAAVNNALREGEVNG